MSSDVESKPVVAVVAPTPIVEPENVHDSEEYESAEEIEEGERYEDDEEGDVEEIEIEVEEEEDEEEEAEYTGSPGSKEKPLDDDEDRKNPQFIPKKGYFYEHDDRMNAEDGEPEEGEPKPEEKPKKVSNVISDRWTHDMFDEDDQAPKTQDELATRYGYDIRSDDMAPRARRRRKYGRGPNTYTRKWEEEEAYQKPRGTFRGGRGLGGRGRSNYRNSISGEPRVYEADFPELGGGSRGGSVGRKGSTGEGEEENKPPRPVKKPHPPRNPEESLNTNNKALSEDETRNRNAVRGEPRAQPPRRPDWDMRDDRGDDSGYGNRGFGRGQRGRGRRSEFRNRNLYPDRRAGPESSLGPLSSKEDEDAAWEKKVEEIRRIEKEEQAKQGAGKQSSFSPAPRITAPAKSAEKKTLPFTNTEYTGSASLTAHRNHSTQPPQSQKYEEQEGSSGRGGRPVAFQHDSDQVSVKLVSMGHSGMDYGNRTSSEVEGDKGRRPPKQSYTTERRPQMPPRLQQQQHQQQVDTGAPAAKPKRFSSQRQRQDPSALGMSNVAGGSVPVLGQPQMGQVVPGTGQMLPSSVPVSVMSGYAPQAYYEQVPGSYEAQVYEGSGSPITIPGNPLGHGPSVSPSMWTGGGYSAAHPYPSPPTGPPVPPAPYGDPSFMSPQPQPIFAPPPYPHPQFIQDPTIINYVPPGPPPSFGPPFHPQGFQGYAQMAPGPPELYHAGGVTYYSTQNQMQRPHILVPTKHPKGMDPKRSLRHHQPEPELYHQYDSRPDLEPGVILEVSAGDPLSYNSPGPDEFEEVGQQFEDALSLQPSTDRVKKSPSPAPLDLKAEPTPSWSDQMAELASPINSPSQPDPPVDLSQPPKAEVEQKSKGDVPSSLQEDN